MKSFGRLGEDGPPRIGTKGLPKHRHRNQPPATAHGHGSAEVRTMLVVLAPVKGVVKKKEKTDQTLAEQEAEA